MVVGLVLIIWPGTSTQVVCMVLGGVLLLYGIIQIVLYLIARERTLYLQGMLMLGIVFGVLGAWILFRPDGDHPHCSGDRGAHYHHTRDTIM